MVGKLKKKFLHVDYQFNLLIRKLNLRQKYMTMKDYTTEFKKLDIRFGHVDDEVEKVNRYLNGLRTFSIKDEINFVNMESVEESYLYALRSEEILTKKHEKRQRERGEIFQWSIVRSCQKSRKCDNALHNRGKS